MSEIRKDGADYIGYEYKEIAGSGERVSFYLDCYQCFGWTLDERASENAAKGNIVLKRERKIINKMELTRLQRHFESCMDEIATLEHSKTTRGTAVSLVVGLIGTAFMAGATFAATHVPPMYVLTIILAIPGFIGWITPYLLYKKIVSRRSKAINELIEQKYDEIYGICEQGNKLLN